MKIFCVLCLLLLATSSLAGQQMISGTLQVNGVDRTYLLHVPTGEPSAKPLPLVLALHGAGMTSARMAHVTGLNAWADKTGFIVVYPQGLEQHWNTTQQPGAVGDDFAFIKELIAKVETSYSVDRSRVIAAGFSQGAEFAQALGCTGDLPFKAIVAISATLPIEAARHCAPKHTVRLIEFHGTADPIVPYLGGRVAAPGGPMVLSVADDLQLWQRINHCAPDPKTDRLPDNGEDGTHVERVSFHACAAGGEVTHYRILGGGHVWPGYPDTPKRLGQTTQQIDASRYIAHLVSGETEQVNQTQAKQDRSLIVGAWSLSTYELRLKPSGTITTPFGPHPVGRILYEENGQMSAQLMRPEMTAFANDDPLSATDAEAASGWRNYIGYWGTYTIDATAGMITHHIEGAWLTNWVGQNQTREFHISGDSLSLDADSAAWHAHLTWKRMR